MRFKFNILSLSDSFVAVPFRRLRRGGKSVAGFTLVELLVVISIIGILSSFAIVSLNTARVKARDALRKGDMAQLRTALVLYYDDHVRYPISSDEASWDSLDPHMGSTPENGSACYNTELTPALEAGSRPIMPRVPKDLNNPNNVTAANGGSDTYLYRYITIDNGLEYAIIYYLEDDPTAPQMIRGW